MVAKEYLEKIYDTLSQEQKLKLALYNDFGEKAQPLFDWLNYSDSNQSDNKPVIDKAKTIYPDGVYYLYKDDSKELFDYARQNKPQKEVKCIGVKMGEHSIAINLKGLQERTLTKRESNDDYNGYIHECSDAVVDWNGRSNTEHIKHTGINAKLDDDEWIPSVAELCLIYLNKRSVNSAINLSGEIRLKDGWLWSSTEQSTRYAWGFNFGDGCLSSIAKDSTKLYIYTVTKFI